MKELFPDFYLPSDEEFKRGWEKALFILDTNVLLDLYRYPEGARKQLIGIFEKIANRLWIPYFVALEYQRNRLNTISSQKQTFDEVKKIIEIGIINIKKEEIDVNSKLKNLNLEKRHSSISVENFIKSLRKSTEEISSASHKFLDELDTKKKEQLSITDIDTIRIQIDKLLAGRIGKPPVSQEYLDEIYKECQFRVDNLIPPGLIDYNNKKDSTDESFCYQGIEYHRKYSDILIWLDILGKCQEHESVIFITSEVKDDWWWSFKPKNEASKTIGIKQELLQEIKAKTNIDFFFAYRTEQFMKFAQEYLNVEINEESITQISDINKNYITLDNVLFLTGKLGGDLDFPIIPATSLKGNLRRNILIAAIEQLKSSKLEERLNAISILTEIAFNSEDSYNLIFEQFISFILKNPLIMKDDDKYLNKKDIQAVLNFIGRREYHQRHKKINLVNAKIGNADLTGASLFESDLSGTDLTGIDLSNANLGDAKLYSANLYSANLSGVNLFQAYLSGANLCDANLTEAYLSETCLDNVNFHGACLYKSNLTGADITASNFHQANLTLANLNITNCYRTNFTESDLQGTDFTGANLEKANLCGANLYGIILKDANLSEANLEDIDPIILENIKLARNWELATYSPEIKRQLGL